MILEKLKPITVTFGADPEFFFERDGKTVGSEKVISLKSGLKTGGSKFIVDGVQAELNPKPDTCRQRFSLEVARSFKALHQKMAGEKGLKVNFDALVNIEKKELDSLNENSRKFGCAPSKNIGKTRIAARTVDASKYLKRMAGGHIHIGTQIGYGEQHNRVETVLKNVPERVVAIMDIIVGNTCVLIDRHPGNIERRKHYGKAGEYRTPEHGLEYRTLSNFWLRHNALMSFVLSLARLSVAVVANSGPGADFEKELLSLVKRPNIRNAINKNDFELAWQNFQKIKPFIARFCGPDKEWPLTTETLPYFEHFVAKGLDHWFKEDPMTHWLNAPMDQFSPGWERFIRDVVAPDHMASHPTNSPKIK